MLGRKMQEEADGMKEKRLMRCTVYEKEGGEKAERVLAQMTTPFRSPQNNSGNIPVQGWK
jgi:hypothetical protein